MEARDMVCIVCPLGCRMTVTKDESIEAGYVVEGNKCKRGEVYGIKEQVNPERIIPTTVRIENALLKRLPVKTENPVPKSMIEECMLEINKAVVSAPVKMGDVIIENILKTGVNIVATRSMEKA